ncbi:folliculin-interacting protein 2-like isoform X2 [Ruditapes philippinarum]|uniref:folliculin-interacting protein 2-like isoform X2 n=1 Tax=Ruditapes philippinarum TaxID=129788 RepID=UPI00295BEE9E|nr:folliculin-interacting protein 2-like isoform X2 [Ruditapes philippinarum]
MKMPVINGIVFPVNYYTSLKGKFLHSDAHVKSWKKPQFDEKSVRLVLFRDSDGRGREIIFDSKCVKEEEKSCRWGKCRPGQKLNSVAEGQVPKNVTNQKFHNYQPTKTGADAKKFEEVMFGAEGVAYRGTSLKVHVVRSPPELILTKVFIPEKPKRLSVADEDSLTFSSAPDLTAPRTISHDSRENSLGIAQSVPVDVPSPSPRYSWMMRSVDLIDEDSGLASLNSSGSFHATYPSPGSSSSGCNSLTRERRYHRGQHFSLESCGRRKSQQDILGELISPNRSKKCKMALGIIFGTIDENNSEANRLFENFFFSHIALFESHLEELRQNVEKAYYSGKTPLFLQAMIESFQCFKSDIADLYTAPRLLEPVWLNMMSYSSYRYMLCDNFLKEFVFLVNKYENKSTNFFMSTLLTAVLSHHLAWVPTVMPAGGSPSATYLDKHSAKWVDTLAKSHPYNPLWAQLGDLYGAIGFPLKLSRTVIVGKKADIVKKILYILSYFIRCSDILESTEHGCLETYLEKLNFSAESPCDSDKNLAHCAQTPSNESDKIFESSPTPVNSCPKFSFSEKTGGDLPSFPSLGLDSLLNTYEVKSSSSGTEKDCNSNNQGSADISGNGKTCPACERNSYSQDYEESNKFGKSVFYVSPLTCYCDKSDSSVMSDCEDRDSSEKLKMQKKKDSLRLSLKIPNEESQNTQNCIQNMNSNTTGSNLIDSEKCRLSMVEIIEDAKVEKAGHSRKAVDTKVTHALPPHSVVAEDMKIPQYVNKVLSHDEMKSIFRQKGSDSMFNEYFDEEGIVAKTIDEIDEKDRVVALPTNKQRNLSGETSQYWNEDDPNKAPSLPDLTAVKTDSSHGKGDSDRSQRNRLGSLDQSYKRRRFSLSRQISESSNKNLTGRCRPITPTELGKKRHMSSMSSFDFDLMDPRAYCQELPLPVLSPEINCSSQKEVDKNFGRSLLADYSDHYMSDFVLHGTSDKNFQEKMAKDIRMALQYSVLDEPIGEAVCIVADTDNWSVNVYSSQHIDKAGNGPLTCVASQLITNCIESVVSMAKLKMSPEFCIMHLEDCFQEIYFKSKMMAECLKKNKKVGDLLAMNRLERSDLPLLVAISGTHMPDFPLVCLS